MMASNLIAVMGVLVVIIMIWQFHVVYRYTLLLRKYIEQQACHHDVVYKAFDKNLCRLNHTVDALKLEIERNKER